MGHVHLTGEMFIKLISSLVYHLAKVVERLLPETEALPQAGQRVAHQLVLGVDHHMVIHAGEQGGLGMGISLVH